MRPALSVTDARPRTRALDAASPSLLPVGRAAAASACGCGWGGCLGVPPPVPEDVGDAVGGVLVEDVPLGDGLDEAVVVVEPAGEAGVVDVGDVVALGGLAAAVVDDGEELVLPLLGLVAAARVGREDGGRHLEVDGEVDGLEHLLAAARRLAVDEALEGEDEDGRQLLEAEAALGLHLLLGRRADVAVEALRAEVGGEGVADAPRGLALDVQLEGEEGLQRRSRLARRVVLTLSVDKGILKS